MITTKLPALRRAGAALALLGCAWSGAQAAATVVVVNANAPNVGFNDPTPLAPVGGNTGTTLGAQRLIAFQHAADVWGKTIDSAVPIRISAKFEDLPCSADSAVLGAAGAAEFFSDFDKAPK